MSYIKINGLKIGADERIMFTGITDASGSEVSRRETRYPGVDGAVFEDINLNPRTFTVNGALFGNSLEDIDKLKMTLINACNPKQEAEVYYHNGAREYYTKALPELPVFSKISNVAYKFVIHLEISGFYWMSSAEIVQGVFRSVDNVFGEFTLPRAFSIREQGADIYNCGSVEAPLIIEITVNSSFSDTITLKNITYGKVIVIENYSFTKGELITIDTDNVTVRSSLNGNIINHLSESSEFFYLSCGYTRIECENANITVITKYRERFLGV